MNELAKTVTIKNELGLHSRPAALVAEIAENAISGVWITLGNERVDASSIIDILTLAAAKGSKITVQVDEKSDMHILDKIVRLVEKGFKEE